MLQRRFSGPKGQARSFLALILLASLTVVQAQSVRPTTQEVLDQVVAEKGVEAMALLAWVSDSVAYEAYPGAMRAAAGTLAAGAGSAADLALLTSALVATADPGAEVRFARCELSAEEAARGAELASARQAPRPTVLLEEVGGFVPQVQDAELRSSLEALATVWSDLSATTAHHADVLLAALLELGESSTVVGQARPSAALATDHVWLQLSTDDGWLDLDPTAAAPGATRCEPGSTSAELPADLLHTLQVDVVVENRVDGQAGTTTLHSTTLLSATVPLVELHDSATAFAVAEAFGDELTEARGPDEAGLLRYTPLLMVGEERLLGEPFYLPSLAPVEAPAAGGGGFGGLGGALGGIMGGLGGSDDKDESDEAAADESDDKTGGATALWLDFTLSSPHGSSAVRSVVFDRIGFAARAAGEESSVVPAELPELDGEYLDLATVWSIGAWTGSWTYAAPPPEAGEDLAAVAAGLSALHGTYEVLRQALVEAVAGSGGSARPAGAGASVRPAGASLTLLGWRPAAVDETEAALVMDVLIDPGPRLAAGTADDEALAATAAWAVASVAAERLVVGVDRLVLPALGEPEPAGAAALDLLAVFEAAESQGVASGWLTSAAGATPPGASPEAAVRIAEHLAAGSSLYLPSAAVTVGDRQVLGWWLLRPTGTQAASAAALASVRDELHDGRHGAMTEYNMAQQPSRAAAPTLRRSLSRRIVCSIGRAIFIIDLLGALSGNPAAGDAAWGLAKGVAKVQEAAEKTRQVGRTPRGSCSVGAGPPVP